MARLLGIPARYRVGYIFAAGRDEALLRDAHAGAGDQWSVQAEASHAWAELYLPHDGWRGFDPTNDTEPGDRHVVVATGRDYNDVKPLAGIFSGSGTSRMFVDVQVTRLQ
jgi:transglutaminase-like putative cysteine protease